MTEFATRDNEQANQKGKTAEAIGDNLRAKQDALRDIGCPDADRSKESKTITVNSYPRELRGLSNNRFGGHNSQRIRGLRGNTYGAASPGRRLVGAERKAVEDDLKRRGII